MRYYALSTGYDDHLGFPWAIVISAVSAAGGLYTAQARAKAEAKRVRLLEQEQRRVIAEAERVTVEAALPPQWPNPVVIVGGVVVVGAVIYFATRRRRRKRR